MGAPEFEKIIGLYPINRNRFWELDPKGFASIELSILGFKPFGSSENFLLITSVNRNRFWELDPKGFASIESSILGFKPFGSSENFLLITPQPM